MTPHRRGFLRTLLAIPGLASVLNWLGPWSPAAPAARSVYQELGVRPLINAAGTYTTLGGSLMPPEVVAAMQSAARSYVNLLELHQAVGQRIARLVGCEAALVTAGCASALTLATAACVAGRDPDKIRRLPDTAGMKNQVIIQKSHRFGYDHAIRNVGVQLVEVETRQQLEQAVNERTALMFFLNHADPLGQIQVEEFARLGKQLGVPTLNDAAADLPPVDNLTRYLKMGYDLVAFSGGKGLRGPQSTGLLLGRKDLIESAMLNNNPHTDTIGRTNKVDKEDLVGLCAAVEHYLKQDHAALWKEWERRVRVIADAAQAVPGVKAERYLPPIANHVPHLRLSWDPARRPPADVVRRLRDGEPRIEIRATRPDGIEVSVWMLEPGEDEIVARRLREVLQ